MDLIGNAIREAGRLLFSGDSGVWGIIGLSLRVSGISVLIATLIGVPIGYLVAVRRFVGRRLALVLVNTGMGLPPVVAGLIVYVFVSRQGPIFELWEQITGTLPERILYTVPVMIAAQVIISTPLVIGVSAAAIGSVPVEMRLQARSLGASPLQEAMLTIREARRGVMAAIVAGFGGIISEVGAVMMVGGNIKDRTQVMTTAIVEETRAGNFGLALALGFILIGIAFVINNGLTALQQSGGRYER